MTFRRLGRKIQYFLAFLIALACVATAWRLSARLAQIEQDFPPEGQFVQVNGHPVHYLQRGQGPDLVLIHGASGNTRDYSFALMDALADRYRVTVFDRPGLGHTPRLARRGVRLVDQTALLVAASDALGISRPIVLGQSFGGAVAMTWALHHPDRIAALVNLSGATYPWPGDLDRTYALLAKPVIGPVVAWVAGAWLNDGYVDRAVEGVFTPQNAPSGYAEYLGAPLNLRPRSMLANAQQRTDLREELRALSPGYADLTLPIEVLHGDADQIVHLDIHSRPMARDVGSAALTVLPGVGHMPHHVAQDQVIAAIDRAAKRAGLR